VARLIFKMNSVSLSGAYMSPYVLSTCDSAVYDKVLHDTQ